MDMVTEMQGSNSEFKKINCFLQHCRRKRVVGIRGIFQVCRLTIFST